MSLRRLGPGDLAAFHAYRSDAEVGRYQGWSPMSEPEAAAFIRGMAAAELFRPGAWVQLAIARQDDDALVGDLGLFVSPDGGHAEVGFTVAPVHQGRGYAAAAVRAAIDMLFEGSAVRRVLGVTDRRNAPSIRVLERAGLRHEETRETVFKGEPCTELVYARPR